MVPVNPVQSLGTHLFPGSWLANGCLANMELCDPATYDDISTAKLRNFLRTCGLKYDNIPNSLDKLKQW